MIPAGILSQFSGIPLDKQVWVSFGVGYSDAGVFVNKLTDSGIWVDLKTADGNDMGPGDQVQYTGGTISDAGGSSGVPQELNRMRLLSNSMGSSGIYVNLDGNVSFTAYVFWVIPAPPSFVVGEFRVNGGEQNNVPGPFNPLPATVKGFNGGYQVDVPAPASVFSRLQLAGNSGTIPIAAVCLILD